MQRAPDFGNVHGVRLEHFRSCLYSLVHVEVDVVGKYSGDFRPLHRPNPS